MTRTVDHDEVEFAGAMTVRFIDVDVTSYDQGGESFSTQDAGMSRFQRVFVESVDGDSVRAEYDRANNNIMLFDGGTEAAGGTTATVEVTAIGRM